ncbi:MAG: hypothetical protein ACW964_13515 [Candidatus Hodarchaeales archaeon]
MDKTKLPQSKYQSGTRYILLWFAFSYLFGCLYLFISILPSVSIWSIQESIIIKGNFFIGSADIVSGSIVNALFLAILWPIHLVVLFGFGWLLAGEIVGYEYDSSLPLVFLVYYIKLTQLYLPIFVIVFVTGLIMWIIVKKRS